MHQLSVILFYPYTANYVDGSQIKNLCCLTSEWIRYDRSLICTQSDAARLLLNKVGHLIEKHLAKIIIFQKIVRSNPGVFTNIVR